MHLSRTVRLSAILAAASLAACTSGTPEGAGNDTAYASPSAVSTDLAQTFTVGDRELYMRCTGTGSPTLLLESGDSVPFAAMSNIQSAFDGRHRVCAYDRANNGRASSPAATPRTAADVHADLDGLLEAADVPPPYVLIGHSAGGFLVQSYARTHPETVTGVLAMNPVPPFDLTLRTAFPSMTDAERAAENAYFRGGEGNGEHIDYKTSGEQLASVAFPRQIAFSMLISTIKQCDSVDDICGRTYEAYEQNMQAVARQWAEGRYTQVPAGHEIYRDDLPAVVQAISELIVRAGDD